MEKRTRILAWTTLSFGILFTGFLSFFAFAEIDPTLSAEESLIATLKHLIPAALVLVATLLGVKFPIVSGILFMIYSGVYLVWTWGQFPLSVYLIIVGPMMVLALLNFRIWQVDRSSY